MLVKLPFYRLTPGLITFVLAALSVVGCQRPHPKSSHAASCSVEQGFSAPDDHGVLRRVPASADNAVIVDICASWCEPCSHAIPKLAKQREHLEQDGVRVVILVVLEQSESIADARRTLTSWGVNGPFMIDRGGAIMRKLGFRSLPATVVLDGSGSVRWKSSTGSSIDDAIEVAKDIETPCGS